MRLLRQLVVILALPIAFSCYGMNGERKYDNFCKTAMSALKDANFNMNGCRVGAYTGNNGSGFCNNYGCYPNKSTQCYVQCKGNDTNNWFTMWPAASESSLDYRGTKIGNGLFVNQTSLSPQNWGGNKFTVDHHVCGGYCSKK